MNLIETLLQTIVMKQDQILAQLKDQIDSPKCGQDTTKKTSTTLQKGASFNEKHFAIAKQIYEIINATTKIKKPNLNQWANEIRKLNEIDEIKIDRILEVFKVANEDDFWSMNVRSPKKLRKHWDRLTLLSLKSKGLNSKGEDKRESLDYFKEKQW